MATSGTTGYALNVSSTSPTSNVWIIDSGASDHMTCDSNKITSLSPSSQSVVSNANVVPLLLLERVLYPLQIRYTWIQYLLCRHWILIYYLLRKLLMLFFVL